MINVQPIKKVFQLSVSEFNTQYRTHYEPVVITGVTSHWPALKKWTHMWFKETFGSVKVSLSVNPTHTMKVVTMSLGEYIDIILKEGPRNGLYLDQYSIKNLPALLGDIETPPYCGDDSKVEMNLWIGPATTIISFHKDNHDPVNLINNLFVQIVGRKRMVLAAPDQDGYMYPRDSEQGAYWHSQVDFMAPDPDRFPLFKKAKLQEAILEPGDMLFIPGDYWHYIKALDRSISLSCWWNSTKATESAPAG